MTSPSELEAAPLATASPGLRRWVFGGLFVTTILGLVGAAFSPYLLVEHPLLLIALSPGPGFMVVVAASTQFVPFVVVGVARRVLGQLAAYGLGYLYGPATARWAERSLPWLKPVIRPVERSLVRHGAWFVLVLPFIGVVTLAGAARTPLRAVLVAATVGQTVVVATTYWAGDAIGRWTDVLLVWLRGHMVEATAATVLAVVVGRWLKGRRGAEGPELDADPEPPTSDASPR